MIRELNQSKKLNSIRLPHLKAAAELQTVSLPIPPMVTISMQQHIGGACEPLVKVNDEVRVGQLIGNCDAFISAPIHSSVSGTVREIKEITQLGGKRSKAIVIETDGLQTVSEQVSPPKITDKSDFITAVRQAGTIGLGGAGFPTAVKITFDKTKNPVDYLIINGVECEPYITSDYREFMENGDTVLAGIQLFLDYLEIPKAIIGIEMDKPNAISKMRELTKSIPNIEVKPLKSAFPQGAEKILIHSATGRRVKAGELPITTGCLVVNVSTISFVYNYIKTGMPLISKRLTIDGDAVKTPMNVFVPVGTPLSHVLNHVDLKQQPDKVVLGGPMMGITPYDKETVISKTSNAILLFKNKSMRESSPCIRCGACIQACSINLMPTEMEQAYDRRDVEMLKKLRVDLCMNCSACSYVCPAKRQLSQKHQLAKALIN